MSYLLLLNSRTCTIVDDQEELRAEREASSSVGQVFMWFGFKVRRVGHGSVPASLRLRKNDARNVLLLFVADHENSDQDRRLVHAKTM